jgi:phosphoadenosine phosphosulfate reductase
VSERNRIGIDPAIYMKRRLHGWLSRLAPAAGEHADVAALSAAFEPLAAEARVERAFEVLPAQHVVSSSFGAQAAVMLHLVTRVHPAIPVVFVDTGYLFAETYRFVDELTERLKLNLRVCRPDSSPAWQESRWGRLWEQGLDGIERYNRLTKVEPMQRALADLGASTWFAGLRRVQAASRGRVPAVELHRGRYKVHPLFDWSDRDVGRYLRAHDLPYHPLWDKGYLSIGDWHTTRPLSEAGSAEALRFFGLKRECGLHES